MAATYVTGIGNQRSTSVANTTHTLAATLSTSGGYLLLVKAASGDSTVAVTSVTSSPALTFTLVVDNQATANYCAERIYSATVPSGTNSVTVTVTYTNSTASTNVPSAIALEKYTGQGTLGATVSTRNTTAQSSLTTTRDGSIISYLIADWNGASGTYTHTSGGSDTIAAYQVSGAIGVYFGQEAVTTSGTTASFGMTAPTGQKATVSAVEVRQFDARSGSSRAAAVAGARTSGTARRVGGSRARTAASSRSSGRKQATGAGWTSAARLASRTSGRKAARGPGAARRLVAGAWASGPVPVPIFNGRPLPTDPLPLSDARYLVQNILTGEWLHTDLPLSDDKVTFTLSGPCEIAGTIKPEIADLKTPDGTPLLRSWGHVIYYEMSGQIRAAALLTEDSYDEQSQTLSAKGVSTYPSYIAYTDIYTQYDVDPIIVARDMWNYVQSFTNANLGVIVTRIGTNVPVRLGNSRQDVQVTDNAGNTTTQSQIVPFTVNWWDAKFCGDIINDMVRACPADYVEQYAWVDSSKQAVAKNVLFAYPRVGRRRNDLRFMQGENILSVPSLESNAESFATAVFGIGAGEGSAAVRSISEQVLPGRLRKMAIYKNTKITDPTQMNLLVQRRLTAMTAGGYEITSIIVQASHINAQFGAYIVGDDILVQATVPHYGQVAIWHRITSYTLARGSDMVQLSLKRSDSFMYGREVES